MVYLVVRMKGTVNVPYWARITLESLSLNKRFRATIIPENEQTLGMLRKIKEYVSWTSVDTEFIREFIEKRGRSSASKLLSAAAAPDTAPPPPPPENSNGQINNNNTENKDSQVADLSKIVSIISQNELYLSKISGIKPWFALNPPKGGFKRKSKRSYSQAGILGENKELLSIVKRMM
ncbi:MAG: uL30 family ribosomal protein [Candidatus Nitrosocosmicus sp.]